MAKRYKKSWWEDQDDYYQSRYGNIFEDTAPTPKETGYKYKSYFYRKGYDFSVGLETRVRQLIKTISGRDLKLAEAQGWGSDKDYFYYNPDDLQNATDDEVLGLIFHQLARELYYPRTKVDKLNKAEPEFRHLLDTLEDNRADRCMVERYNGSDYYLGTVWQSVKKQSTKPRPMEYTTGYDNYGRRVTKTEPPIPAMEFCYNISVLAHAEADYSGYDKKALANFAKAEKAISGYLNAKTFDEAIKHYPAIKKAYPKPDQQQQQQMDQQMGGSMLNEQGRKEAHRNAKRAENDKAGRNMEKLAPAFSAGMEETQKLTNPDYASYVKTQGEQQAVINTLYKLLSSILKDNDTKRYLGRMKRGKIDQKALHKLVTQNSYRIFKKERERQQKKYAFSILVDQSGSMNGQRIQNAFAGTVILAEVFNRLRIPFQIVGFDYGTRTYKNFFSTPRKEVIGGMRFADGGGTNDQFAIRNIGEQFATLPNTYTKSLFVLTDGDGQGYGTRREVIELTDKHQIKVFGFGIGQISEDRMKNTYPKYAMCPQVSDLPSMLVDLVREQFIRS